MLIKSLPHLIAETPVARLLSLQMSMLRESQVEDIVFKGNSSNTFARMGLVPLLIDSFVHGSRAYGENAA